MTDVWVKLGGAGGVSKVDTFADLPATAQVGDAKIVKDEATLYIWDGSAWQPGVSGTSDSFKTIQTSLGSSPVATSPTDTLTLDSSDGSVLVTGDSGTDTIDLVVDPSVINVANLDGIGSLTTNQVLGTDNSGDIYNIPDWNIDTFSGGLNLNKTYQPSGAAGFFQVNNTSVSIDPTADSPDEAWQLQNNQFNLDVNSSGFDFGTGGTAVRFMANSVVHNGTGDMGSIEFITNNFGIGNGTDPISINGVGYMFGFGQINDNVTVDGPLQGYGFQLNVSANAIIDDGQFTHAFYDNANIACDSPSYDSYTAGPTIERITNNHNYVGFSYYPNIDNFQGNANAFGIAIGGNFGTFEDGSYFGINLSSNVTLARNAYGLNITMDNINVYAGTVSTLVIQDLTLTFLAVGDNNNIQVEYTDTVTAGSEVATLAGNLLTVQIQSGVSTATQVKAALDANVTVASNIATTITGVASNPQVAVGPTNFAGGSNPGQKLAANLDGDVNISGSLAFGGALSIGKLNAFAQQAVVSGGGAPGSVHQLISNPTVADNATLTNADTFGLNTAALITIGNNATVTSGALALGLAALGLPAVLSMGTGSTVDSVSGAVFALSLDAGATGGTVDTVNLCRALAIPNGATTVNKLYGYIMELPFGDPGTTSWGVYIDPDVNNFLAGNLKIGGTDLVTNDSVALEVESTTKALVVSRMTQTERDAMTAIQGMVILNTTSAALEYYDGTTWISV